MFEEYHCGNQLQRKHRRYFKLNNIWNLRGSWGEGLLSSDTDSVWEGSDL